VLALFGADYAGVTGGGNVAIALVHLAGVALVIACYAALLAVAAATPQRMPQNVHLATWLRRHHLRSGLAPYWQASSVTVDSGGSIAMLAVNARGKHHSLASYPWEADEQLADPAAHTANFVVIVPGPDISRKLAVRTFGKPARTYRFESYVIMVWDKNLLGQLSPACTPAPGPEKRRGRSVPLGDGAAWRAISEQC